jgi:hypothetical protein
LAFSQVVIGNLILIKMTNHIKSSTYLKKVTLNQVTAKIKRENKIKDQLNLEINRSTYNLRENKENI